MNNIMNMTAKEISILGKLIELAEEAIKASELIEKNFGNAFGVGKTEISVYTIESFGEYFGEGFLTIQGTFRYHDSWWGGRDYSFRCDADSIYRMMRSCYLKNNHLESLDPKEFNCQIDSIDCHFREFISQINSMEN